MHLGQTMGLDTGWVVSERVPSFCGTCLKMQRAVLKPCMSASSPCHMETVLTEKEKTAPKPRDEEGAQKKKISQKKLKIQKLMAWE